MSFEALPARVSLHAAIAEDLVVGCSLREHAIYDTRFLPVAATVFDKGSVVFVVLEGTIVWHTSGEVIPAPSLVVMRALDFEGRAGSGGPTFRTVGPRLRGFEIHVSESLTTFPPRPMTEPQVIAAIERYYQVLGDSLSVRESRDRLCDALAPLRAAGILPRTIGFTFDEHEDGPFGEFFGAMKDILVSSALGATLSLLAVRAQISERHANRILSRVLRMVNIGYEGWRDALQRWRIRAAIVLLSNEQVSIDRVAKAVGFSSGNALTHAFRRAELPSPLQLRTLILEDGPGLPSAK